MFFQGKCVAEVLLENRKQRIFFLKFIQAISKLEKHIKSAKGTGRELGKGKGTGKTQHFATFSIMAGKGNWINTAFSTTPGKGNSKNTAFAIIPGKGNLKNRAFSISLGKGNWKSTAFGRTFATRPDERGFIIHYYDEIM